VIYVTPEPSTSSQASSITTTSSIAYSEASPPPSDFEHVEQATHKQKPLALTDDEAKELCESNMFFVHPNRTERKVYDLFLAGSELEWLEIRLNTLDPVVDYFVIVEASKTFTYNPKPLYFSENYSKFEKFADKIIYRVLDFAGMENNSTWERERYQRQSLFNAVFPSLLGEQAPVWGDVLLVSDLDEIPKEDTVLLLKNCKTPPRVTVRSDFYYYSFQWQHHASDWHHPQATFYQGEDTILPDDLRMGPGDVDLQSAAWHCSSCLSTVSKMQHKIESFSHTEYNHARFKDPAQIVRRVRNGIDLFDRESELYDKIVDNEDLPTYLKYHKDRFPWIVDRDPPNANFLDYEGEGAESLDDFEGDMNDK
jgi:beta-1,4-mannosyl-glycoprotein beta-1,4-N-acetylglucosaminyltransferase